MKKTWFLFFLLFSLSQSESFGERILLFAPHPDDEAIPLGGFIADRIASGAEVWAVVVTDGEAFAKALRVRIRAPAFFLMCHDFRKLGKKRRLEAKKSLEILGVRKDRSFFLGYPASILFKLVCKKDDGNPQRSKATNQRYGISEWGEIRRKPHPYSRNSLAADLDSLIGLSNPDIVVLPHPRDFNQDHRAVNLIVRERLLIKRSKAKIMGYLVHLGSRFNYPKPYGYHPNKAIADPPKFPVPRRFRLSDVGLAKKEKALRAHVSQIQLKDGFLLSFISREELFWDL